MILYSRLRNHPFFTENIYNWVSIDSPESPSEVSLYQSIYSSSVKDFYDKKKSDIPRTMGYPQTPQRPPYDFLKKHSGERKIAAESKSVPCICRDSRRCHQTFNQKHLEETPVLLKHSKRDFLTENSLLAQRKPSSTPDPKVVDDRKGHSFKLEESGWVPKYRYKEDYGQKPKYIEDIEKSLEESRNAFKEFLRTERHIAKPEKMSEETKKEIFDGLVANWKELLRRYLTLPIQTETPLQIRRKLEIERRIDSLEQDIELLMRHKDIFIGKDTTVKR